MAPYLQITPRTNVNDEDLVKYINNCIQLQYPIILLCRLNNYDVVYFNDFAWYGCPRYPYPGCEEKKSAIMNEFLQHIRGGQIQEPIDKKLSPRGGYCCVADGPSFAWDLADAISCANEKVTSLSGYSKDKKGIVLQPIIADIEYFLTQDLPTL